MPYAVRPLKAADVDQSAAIEREAFPSAFPPTPFLRELKNRPGSYLVAWRRFDVGGGFVRAFETAPAAGASGRGLVGALLSNARSIWNGTEPERGECQDFIVGFIGIWHVADEAHIVNIGVMREHRGQGIGELLLLGAIEQAMARRADVVTLEVRPSNQIARRLYGKYGFKEVGLRKRYYADDGEDAIIMTTDPILAPPYLGLIRDLEREHQRRWGRAERVLS